jgi:hypothetical protein
MRAAPRPLAPKDVPSHDCPIPAGGHCDVHLYASHPELLASRDCVCAPGIPQCAWCVVRAAISVRSVKEANKPVRTPDVWHDDLLTPTTTDLNGRW